MLLHSLRALYKGPGGVGSIRKYMKALARAAGVSGRCAYSFRTKLHFADEAGEFIRPNGKTRWPYRSVVLLTFFDSD